MEDTDLWTEEKEDDLQGRIQKFDKGGELWFLEQANSKYWSNQDLSGIFEY
jgi:hypothetical protein